MGTDKLWQVLIIASLILLTINHPILMVLVGAGVFVYHKNPWGLKMKITNLFNKAKNAVKSKPQSKNKRLPRV